MLECFGVSEKGIVREENQDSIYWSVNENYGIFIVADGMGGAKAGGVASKNAIKYVSEYISNNFEMGSYIKIKELIKQALYYANTQVYNMSISNKEYSGMGTTIIVSLVVNDKIYIGHIGDSSLYRIRNNIIRKITKDHSYVQKLIDEKTITKKEALVHPKRNMLLKALGCEKTVIPDVMMKKFQIGDYIVMCTDGLSNLVKEKEILMVASTLNNTKQICEKLKDTANLRGGYDNISVIIVKK